MQDHILPPVALGPLVASVRTGLENCQEDLFPLPQRLPLPAPEAFEILELAEGLRPMVEFSLRNKTLYFYSISSRHHHLRHVLQPK